MKIEPVSSKCDLQAFINLPYQLYRRDPTWVPPLRSEQRAQFSPQRNPMLRHCEYQLFLAREGDEVVGRISAFIDHLALEHWGQPIGLFGSFECVNDPRVSEGLLASARAWLRAIGCATPASWGRTCAYRPSAARGSSRPATASCF